MCKNLKQKTATPRGNVISCWLSQSVCGPSARLAGYGGGVFPALLNPVSATLLVSGI